MQTLTVLNKRRFDTLSYRLYVTIKVIFRYPSVIPYERNFYTEMRYVTYVGLRCKLFFEMCSAVVGTKLGGYLRLSVSSLVRSVNIVGIQGSFVIRDR